MYKNILVATDGSALAQIAVAQGVALAAALHARICFVTVSEPFHLLTTEAEQIADTQEDYRRRTAERAGRILDAAAEAAAARGVEAVRVHVEANFPHEAIISTATSQKCDLVVMASHGRSGLSAMVLGSETTKVLTHSAIPVLVVRAEPPPAAEVEYEIAVVPPVALLAPAR